MTKKLNHIAPRERILETAGELFFYQGYRATGINEVIAKSGVAKATFYNHFPTKEDLCLAYLQERNTSEYDNIIIYVNEQDTPLARFLAVIEAIEPWLAANALRGCCFLNMVAEIPDPENRLRRLGDQHYNMVRALIQNLAQQLIASDEGRYAGLNVKELAKDYMIILVGAIAMSEVYNDLWPVRQAVVMVKRLID
ncbi:MAG: TetR/AcrR family transcriptional regulator [Desulfuromonadales bacterium]